MFSKYEQRYFITIQRARGKNARQYHTALLDACATEILIYNVKARWAYEFRRASEDVHHCRTAIIAVEQSVRRLVQRDALDGIRYSP